MSIALEMKVAALEGQVKELLTRAQALEDTLHAQSNEIQVLKRNVPRK